MQTPLRSGFVGRSPAILEKRIPINNLRLRDDIGPFRLAHLEAVLRVADERASAQVRTAGVCVADDRAKVGTT